VSTPEELSTKTKQKEELNRTISQLEQKTAKVRASARGFHDDEEEDEDDY